MRGFVHNTESFPQHPHRHHRLQLHPQVRASLPDELIGSIGMSSLGLLAAASTTLQCSVEDHPGQQRVIQRLQHVSADAEGSPEEIQETLTFLVQSLCFSPSPFGRPGICIP